MKQNFASPEEAEDAFYQAIMRADLEAMMNVWADDEEIGCIHPDGQYLQGVAAVRENWRAMFTRNLRVNMRITRSIRWSNMLLSVHSVIETIFVGEEGTQQTPTLATNVFQRGAKGWKMLLHHASFAADTTLVPKIPPPGSDNTRILH